jgi:alpha-2-macroglobulin
MFSGTLAGLRCRYRTVSQPNMISAALFAVLGLASAAESWRNESHADPAVNAPRRVLSVAPQGTVTSTVAVQVSLDGPVAPLGQTEVVGISIEIDPPVAARVRWASPSLLEADLDDLAAATRYTARVRWGGPGPSPVAGLPISWNFETAGPALDDVWPSDELGLRAPIIVKVDQPASFAEVRQHLGVSWIAAKSDDDDDTAEVSKPDPTKQAIPTRITIASQRELRMVDAYEDEEQTLRSRKTPGVSRFWAIRPVRRWPPDGTLAVTLSEGMRGTLGSVSSKAGTLLVQATVDSFRVKDISCGNGKAPCEAGDMIDVTLSSAVGPTALSKIRITPRPASLGYDLSDFSDGEFVSIRGAFIAGTTYQLTLPANLKDKRGRSLGSFNGGRNVVVQIPFARRSRLEISPTGGVFPQPTKPLIGIQSRFLSSLEIRTAPLSDALAMAVMSASPLEAFVTRLPAATRIDRPALHTIGPNGWAETVFNLDEMTASKMGMHMIEIRAGQPTANTFGPPPEPLFGFIQRTNLAPVGWVSPSRLVVLPLQHSDLSPAGDVHVSLLSTSSPPRWLGQVAAPGILDMNIQGGLGQGSIMKISRTDGSDTYYHKVPFVSGTGTPTAPLRSEETLQMYATVERDLLRPGDSVNVVGWVLIDSPDAPSGLRWLPKGTPVRLMLADGKKQLDEFKAQTDATGKFSGKLRVPTDPQLGRGKVSATVETIAKTIGVRIEDIQPPAIELHVTAPSTVVSGDDLTVAIEAKRLSGEPAALSQVDFASHCHAVQRPPSALLGVEPGWTIGPKPRGERQSDAWTRTGWYGDGTFSENIDREIFKASAAPLQCNIDVVVTDSTRQQVADSASVFVHARRSYLAVKLPATARKGERPVVKVRIVSTSGERLAGRNLRITAEPAYRHATQQRTIASCIADAFVDRDGECRLVGLSPGYHVIRVRDPAGKSTSTEIELLVLDERKPERRARNPTEPQSGLQFSLAEETAAPGQTLHATITSPVDGPGVLIVSRSGIREHHPFTTRDNRATVAMIVKESWVPRVSIQVAQAGHFPTPRGNERAKVEHVERRMEIGQTSRTLSLSLASPPQARPGEQVRMIVSVRSHDGRPAPAQLAIWAVDEAFLLKTNFRVLDPVDALLPSSRDDVRLLDPFVNLVHPYSPLGVDPSVDAFSLGNLGAVSGGSGSGYGRGVGGITGRRAADLVRRREPSNPVALFIADLATDKTGEAHFTMQVPDELTRYRITVLASAALPDGAPGRFGFLEQTINVQQPLVLRVATPRMLRPGDRAQVAAVIRNLSGADGVAEIVATALPSTTGAAPAFVKIPATVRLPVKNNAEIRVPFEIEATRPGTIQLDFSASLRAESDPADSAPTMDAIRFPLEISPESAAVDRSAMYLTLADGDNRSMLVRIPAGTAPGGGVSVVPSLSLLGEGLDAAQFLIDYPHGCAEQTASALIGMMGLRMLHEREVHVLPPTKALINARVLRLLSMQTPSGGFSYWPGPNLPAQPDVTAYVVWALTQARGLGMDIPEQALNKAMVFLESRATFLGAGGKTSRELAFALAALASADKSLPSTAMALLYRERKSLDSIALAAFTLAMSLAEPTDGRLADLADLLAGMIEQTAGFARIAIRSSDAQDTGIPFASRIGAQAMAALAFLRNPAHAQLGEKLIRGLLDARRDGRWRTTPDNAFAVLALAEQARREHRSDSAILRASLAKKEFINRELRGSGSSRPIGFVAREALSISDGSITDLPMALSLHGGGPAYVRVGTEWVMANPQPTAQGLEVTRTLHADGLTPIVEIAEGNKLSCTLTVRNHTTLRYVAVNVPLPAGMEVARNHGQSALLVPGFSHHEAWRDHVALYADSLSPGTHTITIPLRAVTPGDYLVPTATAEAMYEPDVHGRTGRTRIRVVARTDLAR